ncbi:hypothetical protein Tco_1247146 [Tanacetum coccineum]
MYPPPQQFTPVYAAPIHHQHHHNQVNPQQQSVSPQPFISPSVTQQSQDDFPQLDSSLAVPTFQQGEDPIDCINKAMAFLSVMASRGIATTLKGNYAAGQVKFMKCYNCLGERHMAKQCTQPKRPRNYAWFKEKLVLVEAQEAAFLTEDLDAYDSDCNDISSAKVVLIANLSSCDSDVLSEVPYFDTYPNDMINLDVQEMPYSEQTHIDDFPDNEITSDSNIIPYSQYLQESQDAGIQDTNSSAPNDLLVLSLVEQMTDHVANLDKENQTNKMVNESLTAELERYKERVAIFEQRLNVDLNKREKLIDSQMDDLIRNRNAKFAAFQQEIDTLKETLSNQVKEKESLSTTLTVFKTESKEKESKYIDKEIVLENQNKELENTLCKLYRSTQAMHMLTKPQVFYDNTHKQALGYQNPFHLKKAQRIKPTLYDGSVIAKEHDVISVIDDEETLILEEESRSKMLDKQNDPISIKQKINISPIDYSKLNKIKEDFGKRFVTKKELSTEQVFWLKHSNHTLDTSVKSHTPVRGETPSELPKLSLVNESLKKLKYHLVSFDKEVKKRITSDAITAGAWGFEHTEACFVTEIIPFLKVLKDTFNAFDKTLLDEITEVQTVFNQMEGAVDQCFVDKNALEIQIKQLSIDNDQLLNQIMSQEIVHIAVNSVDILDVNKSCVNECNKCLELETELLKKKDFIEKYVYDKLVKSYSTLEKHCISLELATQLNQEIFQKNNSGENQNAPTFNQLFKINELKAQS